jgi:HD-GYP domain-containing protein (c-di-GMP phosphodiesterase class II)
MASLSLATDIAIGVELEHGLRSTLVAMRLADRLGLDGATASETYYACLLFYVGCTADDDVEAEIFGGDLAKDLMPATFGSRAEVLVGLLRTLPDPGGGRLTRAAQIARGLPRAARAFPTHQATTCEVGQMLTKQLGLPPGVQALFGQLHERWDGKGWPGKAAGDEIALPVRIAHVARDAALQAMWGGTERATRVIRERAGSAFDPAVAAPITERPDDLAVLDADESAWEETLAAEPGGHLTLDGAAIDDAMAAMGAFADIASPYLIGHSGGVAELAAQAAIRCRFEPDRVTDIKRAAFVHDLGRVAVPVRIWQKPGPLTQDEWERVRLHAYHSERILCRSPFLAELARVATSHHERLDGSGYHRGAVAAGLGPSARILAAADAYHAMTEPRPHRAALTPEQAAGTLGRDASEGRLDPDAVGAVLGAAATGRRRSVGPPA